MSLVASLKRLDRALFPDLLVRGLARETAASPSVLDVGCGQGGPMAQVPKPLRLVGLDGHAPSIERLRARGLYDELLCAPLAAASVAPKSFDTVVCLDVIEHFEKPQALALIAALESWAVRKVVLATPNGFLPQRPYDDNPFQEHKCGFSVAELRGLGYRVHGTGGPKPLRGEEAVLRFWPRPLWHRISGALQPLTWIWPQGAFGLLAVKELKR
jgi:SAM-dependent methyltransferase